MATSASRFGDDYLHENTTMDALKALQVRFIRHVSPLMIVVNEKLCFFQKLGNIKETGVLDDATKELLQKPRCGNPDFEITQGLTRRRRQKRFVLGPSKWGKLDLTWK